MNEDDDEANAIGATRYPCMPSLVSLQQMRNRHHLAQLGKKLMKWTALATGRELRKITEDMHLAYDNLGDDIRDCYIMLARSRYYYPNLNKMVIENVPNQANIRVSSTTKTTAGVKTFLYGINDNGCEPYQHLAIEKGGQIVKDTKDAWVELLKRMIMIVQLRQAFKQVHEANRSATKRQNVLSKTVIPRVLSSIHYIILELEELAREELYRIKKVVEVKKKKKAKIKEKLDAAQQSAEKSLPPSKDSEKSLPPSKDSEKSLPPPKDSEKSLPPPKDSEKSLPPSKDSEKSLPPSKEDSTKSVKLAEDSKQFLKLAESSEKLLKPTESSEKPLKLTESSEKPLKLSESSEKILKLSESSEKPLKLSEGSENQSLIDDDLIERLEHLECHLGSVLDIFKVFREKINVSPSVEDFNNLCQTVYDRLDQYFRDVQSRKVLHILTSTPDQTRNVKRRECHIEHSIDTEKMTEDFKSKEIIASGSDTFLEACAYILSRIASYKNDDKYHNLKDHIRADSEQSTTGTKEDGIGLPESHDIKKEKL